MEIKCDKCGATLQYSPGTQDLVCEYCGHTMKLTAAPDPNADVISDSILPLKVDNDTAISVARAYMTSGLVTCQATLVLTPLTTPELTPSS